MTDAISIALSSMQVTAVKASDAANNVAHASLTTPSSPSDLAVTPAVINDTGKVSGPDVLQDVLDFQEAARTHEAQLKAFQTLNDIQQKLVEALGWVISQTPDTATLAQGQSNYQSPSSH